MSDKKINPWIAHCKNYVKEYGCSYKDAIKLSRPSYKPTTNRIKPEPATKPVVEEVLEVPIVVPSPAEFKLLELQKEELVDEVEYKLAKLTVKRPPKKKEIKKQ